MKKHILFLTKVTITIGLLAFVGQRIDWTQLADFFVRANRQYILAAFGLALLNLALLNLRWLHVIRCKPFARVRYRDLMDLSLIGIFFNTFVPGGIVGDVVRGHKAKQYDMNGKEAFGSVIVDRCLGLIGLITFSIAGLAMGWSELSGYQWVLPLFWLSFSGIAGYFLLVNPIVSRWLVTRLPVPYPLLKKILRLYKGAGSYPSSLHYWVAVCCSLLTAGLTVATMVCLSHALGCSITLVHMMWLVPTVGVLSTIPVSLNGWGIREAGYVFFLEQIGVPTTQALALSMSFGAIILMLGAVGGLWYGLGGLFPAPSGSLQSVDLSQSKA